MPTTTEKETNGAVALTKEQAAQVDKEKEGQAAAYTRTESPARPARFD